MQGCRARAQEKTQVAPAPHHGVSISPCLCSCVPANVPETQPQELRSKAGREDLTLPPRKGLKEVKEKYYENRVQPRYW